MYQFKDIFEDQYRFSLKSIQYKGLEEHAMKPDSKIEFGDKMTVGALNGRELHVECKRELWVTDIGANLLSVSFDIIYTLKNGITMDDSVRAALQKVLAEPHSSAEVYARSSVLISQILMLGLSNTIVLPPQYTGPASA